MFSFKSCALILLFFLNNISYAAGDPVDRLEEFLNGVPLLKEVKQAFTDVPWKSSLTKAEAGAALQPAQRNTYGPWVLHMIQSGGAATLEKIVKIPVQVEAAKPLLEDLKRTMVALGREKEEAGERARKSLEDQARIQTALEAEQRVRAEEKNLLGARIAAQQEEMERQTRLLSEREAALESARREKEEADERARKSLEDQAHTQAVLDQERRERAEEKGQLEAQVAARQAEVESVRHEGSASFAEIEQRVRDFEREIERLMEQNAHAQMVLEDERVEMHRVVEDERMRARLFELRLEGVKRLYQSTKKKLTEIYDAEVNESLKKMLSAEEWLAYKDLPREGQLAYRKDFFSKERTEAREAQRKKAVAVRAAEGEKDREERERARREREAEELRRRQEREEVLLRKHREQAEKELRERQERDAAVRSQEARLAELEEALKKARREKDEAEEALEKKHREERERLEVQISAQKAEIGKQAKRLEELEAMLRGAMEENTQDTRERLVRRIGSVAAMEERDVSDVYEENKGLRAEIYLMLKKLMPLEEQVKEAMRARDLAQAEKRMAETELDARRRQVGSLEKQVTLLTERLSEMLHEKPAGVRRTSSLTNLTLAGSRAS